MNEELSRQRQALVTEKARHYAKAAAMLRAVKPTRGLVVDRKLLTLSEIELLQAEFVEILQESHVYRQEE